MVLESDGRRRFAAQGNGRSVENSASRRRLLARIPHVPAAVEIRALLEDDRTEVAEDAGGAVVNNDALDLAAVFQSPSRALIESLRRQVSEGRSVLSLAPFAPEIPIASEEASVFVANDMGRMAALQAQSKRQTRKMVVADLLSVEDTSVRAELAQAFDRTKAEGRHVFVSTVGMGLLRPGRAVAFAYASYRCGAGAAGESELFDVAVDTLADFRRQGHAQRACAAMVAAEGATKGRAVWATTPGNVASIATARSLGFEATGESIWVGTFHAWTTDGEMLLA